MNKKSLDALQYCLQAMEDGADLRAVLARYPEIAEELRPLLIAAQQARALGVPNASEEAMRRGRQRLLMRANELRARRRSTGMPRVHQFASSMVLTLILLLSGTGLVQASTSTLPGDNLYPVKRTWEDVKLLFIFSPGPREALEGEYEQERLEEVSEVLQEGRVVLITFTGLITAQQNGQVTVSGVPVAITNQTQFSGTQAIVGAPVIVTGQTDLQGHVIAFHVQVLPPGSVVPLGESLTAMLTPMATAPPIPGTTPAPESRQGDREERESAGKIFHLEGTIQSMQADSLLVDGRTVYLNGTRVEGKLEPGAQIEVEGYFTPEGRFVAVKIEVETPEINESESQNNAGNEDDHEEGDHEEDDSVEDESSDDESDH